MRASNALKRAANQTPPVQKAIGDIALAIDDASAAIALFTSNPAAPSAPGPAMASPSFTPPPRPAPNRNVGLEISLTNLKTAFETFARAPGGDLGGLRAKVNQDIAVAARSLIVAMEAANAEFVAGRRGGGPGPASPPQ